MIIAFQKLLTVKPFDLDIDIKIFGLSRLCETNTGDLRCSDVMISLVISGGADAERAIKGTPAIARNPPILRNAVRKSAPLHIGIKY